MPQENFICMCSNNIFYYMPNGNSIRCFDETCRKVYINSVIGFDHIYTDRINELFQYKHFPYSTIPKYVPRVGISK